MLELKIDLHIHTSDDRADYVRHSAKELIRCAAQKGFKAISITNHDSVTYNHEYSNYAVDRGILLIPGIEKTIEGKHVLILKAFPAIEKINTFAELQEAKRDGIFIIAPHPFFKRGCCLEERLHEHLDLFDAIEFSFFYSKWLNLNRKAIQLSVAKSLPLIGNSDCHLLEFFGICHSVIKTDDHSADGIFSAIRNKNVRVVTQPMPFTKLIRIFYEMTSSEYKSGLKLNNRYPTLSPEIQGKKSALSSTLLDRS